MAASMAVPLDTTYAWNEPEKYSLSLSQRSFLIGSQIVCEIICQSSDMSLLPEDIGLCDSLPVCDTRLNLLDNLRCVGDSVDFPADLETG